MFDWRCISQHLESLAFCPVCSKSLDKSKLVQVSGEATQAPSDDLPSRQRPCASIRRRNVTGLSGPSNLEWSGSAPEFSFGTARETFTPMSAKVGTRSSRCLSMVLWFSFSCDTLECGGAQARQYRSVNKEDLVAQTFVFLLCFRRTCICSISVCANHSAYRYQRHSLVRQ
jgi:hypothetical protein